MESPKFGEKKGSAHYLKHMSSSVKHGGKSVMPWACMAVSRVGSLICSDGCNGINSEVYKNIVSQLTEKCVQTNWEDYIMQQDHNPKHTANTTKDFIREKR